MPQTSYDILKGDVHVTSNAYQLGVEYVRLRTWLARKFILVRSGEVREPVSNQTSDNSQGHNILPCILCSHHQANKLMFVRPFFKDPTLRTRICLSATLGFGS